MPANYTTARKGYLDWFSHLLSPPETDPKDTRRSAGEQIIDGLENKVDGLNFASEELTEATRPYLIAEDPLYRVAAVDSLLQQVQGDLAIANMLWDVIERTGDDDEAAEETLTRSVRSGRLHDTFRRIVSDMPASMDDLAKHYQSGEVTRGAASHRPETLAESIEDLRFEIHETLDIINDRATNVSLRIIRDIITVGSANWVMVTQAVDLLQGQQKVGDVGWGLEDEVERLTVGIASALRGVLVNVVAKILLIIEKNDLVRYTIADWLEEIHEAARDEQKNVFSVLLEQLYQVENFRTRDLNLWLKDAVDIDRIHVAANDIMQLGDNFDHLAGQIKRLSTMTSVGTLFLNPALISVGLALQVGLLSTLVFAGYDHLDEGSRALNIARGIKETLIEDLPISKKTLQDAELIARRQMREKSRIQRTGSAPHMSEF